MNIAQITWVTFPNFGTFLQAYALQRIINNLGYESTLIDDSRFTYYAPSLKKNVRDLINFIRKPSRTLRLYKIRRKYIRFADKFLKIDCKWKNTAELSEKYDAFVCGSDQIWSPLLDEHYSGFYFASFAPKEKLKIAYAPSLGTENFSKEYAKMAGPWISEFDALSVRESVGQQILEKITGRNDVQTVLDPTLLLRSDEWRTLLGEHKSDAITEPYVLVYLLTFNEEYIRQIRKIANKRKLRIVSIGNDGRLKPYSDEYVTGVGPLEFLSLIDKARYVITDSFHGTIFSFQFQCPFLTLKRFRDDAQNNQNTRVENLFQILGITDNFYGIEELSSRPLPENIDWKKAEDRLAVMREKSILYLQNAFQCQN